MILIPNLYDQPLHKVDQKICKPYKIFYFFKVNWYRISFFKSIIPFYKDYYKDIEKQDVESTIDS